MVVRLGSRDIMQITNYMAGIVESCDWACHQAARNRDLGDDFLVANGTPIRAAFNGTLRNAVRNEPAPYRPLYIAYLDSDEAPGLSFEYMHLSKFQTPGHYAMGQTIGWSGGIRLALGSGQATGPHLHENAVVNGKLTPVAQIFEQFASITIKAGDPVLTLNAPFIVNPWNLVMSPGYIKNAPGTQAATLALVQGGVVNDVASAELMAELMWDMGLQEFLPNGVSSVIPFLKTLNNGGFAVASWLKTAPATTGPATLIDYPAVAKAVNDDAASRRTGWK